MIRRVMLALAALVLAPVPATAQADLAVETARVQDLSSIRQIKNLQATWGHLAIAGDWSAMAGLLTENALVVFQHGGLSGREDIEADLRHTQGGGEDGMPANRLNLRLWLSPVITLAPDGQSAIGRWHEIAMTGVAGESADWAGGTWVIRYRKVEDGWRITHMRNYHQFDGPYATGWSHDAESLERAPYHYTPDEAGLLLPQRAASQPQSRPVLDWEAVLLLRESEARNLVNAYGYYLDRGMYDDIVDLFAEDTGATDAEIDVAGQGRWVRRAGVRAYLSRFGQAGLADGELNDRLHLMPTVVVAAGGQSAIVRVIELGMSGQHGGLGYFTAAQQQFVLRREHGEGWRIVQLRREPLFNALYSRGWVQPLLPQIPPSEGGATMLRSELEPTGYPAHATLLNLEDFERLSSILTPYGGRTHPLVIPNALDRAEAFDAAENVSNAYGYYIDQFAWRNTAALFSRDGWKELSYIGTFIGRDNVLASLIQRYGEGGPRDEFQAIHQLTQPYVTPSEDGQRAQIRSRLWQFNSSTEPGGSWIGGIYENQVIKEDGVWRIHGMDLDYVWLADVATGWTGVDPDANARFGVSPEVIAQFGPQAPLRGEVFAPYPRIAPMGFHYANPVSGREPDVWLHWSDGYRAP